MSAVVADIERIVCELPFTERQARITEREVYTWNVVELCKVTLSTGEIGWGETVLSVRALLQTTAVAPMDVALYGFRSECMCDVCSGVPCVGTMHRWAL